MSDDMITAGSPSLWSRRHVSLPVRCAISPGDHPRSLGGRAVPGGLAWFVHLRQIVRDHRARRAVRRLENQVRWLGHPALLDDFLTAQAGASQEKRS